MERVYTMNGVLNDIWSWLASISWTALLVKLVVLDVITGTAVAIRFHEIDSSISRDGIFRKIGIFLAVIVAFVLEPYANGLPINTDLVAICFCIPEGQSIFENLDELGVKVPYIAQFFARLQEQFKKDIDTNA